MIKMMMMMLMMMLMVVVVCVLFLQVLALVFIRKLLDCIFTKRELSWLDDLMPESKKKKLEDAEEVTLLTSKHHFLTLM